MKLIRLLHANVSKLNQTVSNLKRKVESRSSQRVQTKMVTERLKLAKLRQQHALAMAHVLEIESGTLKPEMDMYSKILDVHEAVLAGTSRPKRTSVKKQRGQMLNIDYRKSHFYLIEFSS